MTGNGNGGPDETTGWQQVELTLGNLAAGSHRLILGGYNNQKTHYTEYTTLLIDDLSLNALSSNQPPTAVASATPDNGVAPLEVSFSSAGSSDADGSIQSYSWVFGDGGSATDANPSHSYTSPGSYTATLTVTDDQGGSDSSSLTIVVAEAPDTVAPVITLNGGSSVTREAGPVAYSDPGATASDDRDGDLSANLQASGSVDHATAGTYTLTYQVADAAGNQATATRTVIVVAGSAPVITLLGDNPMTLQAGETFVDPGATANDTFDGDLSGSIVVSGVVDSSTAGSYTVTYSVTDAAGNSASASRSVEVVDSSDPVITLEGDNPVAIEAGTPFIDPGASAEDDVDGDITDRILVDGEVDVETAGSYQLTYTVSDSAGNTATVIRTVDVVAASAPIIALLGDNPYEVELGVEFSDPGATANDAFDGDISDRIEVTGSVDSGSVGSYMLVYSVSDNAGNSTEEMRTVLVVENPPVEFNVSNNIHVDQFGYLPDGEKVAVIAAPQEGFNSADTFAPGSDYQVRRTADDSIAFIGALTQWNEGATNDQSGDKAWWFDFSELTETGEFYVYDPENEAASHPFDIRADVYTDVLKQAVRSYFYQRVNFAKQEPYADPRWVDSASHGGAEQDYDVRAMIPEDPESSDPATGRDLHGGWYDAGDYNKYINYADGTVHNLLYAYQERPAVWGDDYQIPESGNGVPDLLDEVRWEMEWMLRMQIEDGSVLHKLASINWNGGSPPSSDVTPRRYAPPTASATISAAGAYAHAALVYSDFNAEFADTLRQAALDAWGWLEENPESIPSNFDNAGFVNAAAEDCGYDDARCESHQLANRLNAAIHLFALTGEQRFQDYILAHAESDALLLGEGGYLVFDGMQQEVQDALIYYAGLDGADAGLVETIQAQLLRAMSLPEEWVPFSPLARFQEQKDPYRAYLDEHHWGSNRGKGNAGNLMFSTAESGFDPGSSGDYGSAAQGYLHYLHGVNPHNIAYLSNMDEFGADNSVPEFYHLWFNDGSELWDGVENSLYGPAPGYLVGGPNEHYWRDGVYIDDIEDAAHRLNNQPSMKRYWSWNGSENSYEITENSITYQAPYIRLLSKYLPGSSNEIWRPAPGTSWQWQINSGEVDTSFNVDMYDVDLFEASGELIASLKAQGRVVICYFSAGSFEDWRSDAEDFPASVIGNQLDEWPGESWLDIRDIDQLGPIMAARLDLAVAKGCDGVEPDNVDGYTNSSGFELTGEDQLAYNRWLAAQAHQRGLSIGLKNDLNQVEALLDDFDWALNEQCFEYEECDLLMPFIEAGKAVFGVTYGGAADAICPVANEMGFSWLMKNWDLDAWRIDCLEYGGGE
ncbi:protein of unknown function (DUF5011) [endosymbiont of Ridgeia piscesae]|uniref:PKD domain-containing protein n=1 Tax=endosymbiont of Ridgeia piscesae TaxID=54398 RepID=A0A0T5Z4T9_9GAMM|nr:protein of unknown function (DUF5011) [endosymbiont of Ridgeia piscesae]